MHKVVPDIPVTLLTTFRLFIPRINPNIPNIPSKITIKKINARMGMLSENNDKPNKIPATPKIKESIAFFL